MKKQFFLLFISLSVTNVTFSSSCLDTLRDLHINSITQKTAPDDQEQLVQAWSDAFEACKKEHAEHVENNQEIKQSLNKMKRNMNFIEGFSLAAFTIAFVNLLNHLPK